MSLMATSITTTNRNLKVIIEPLLSEGYPNRGLGIYRRKMRE